MIKLLTSIVVFLSAIISCQSKNTTTILCFGNSLTSGFGLAIEDAYPALLEKKLEQTYNRDFNVINEGVSGELSAQGLARLPQIINKLDNLDYFILELGVNDAFQKNDINDTKSNLLQIVKLVNTKFPKCKIVIAEVDLTYIIAPTDVIKFHEMYANIVQITHAIHIKSLMEGIPANSENNLDDGIHPNEKGTQLMMENIFKALPIK